MKARPLTAGEIDLARSIYADMIDYTRVEIRHSKWAFFQPKNVVMAPRGNIHFHPGGTLYRDDFAQCPLHEQGLFVHEMCHIWQHQRGIFLPLARHPFCRYHYSFIPGRPLSRYGIEQQAEIVRHAFLLRNAATVIGAPSLARYESVLPFGT